ncbi:hypothetical protein CNR22_00705 [Sphingobacteriaceae bacterium]|nr:hypothetical protein CNR22_00705 [Sphingobacteriaceae bacterium]
MTDSKLLPNLYTGLSGLIVPVPKYGFPEEHKLSSRLTYYSTFFNSLEINSTFYKLPLASTLTKWLQQVPSHFRFTFKLWKEITHVKNLDFKVADVEKFFHVISAANSKKGTILIQFPPSLGKFFLKQLEFLLECIAKNNEQNNWSIAVEFRNKSWYEKEVYKLLKDYNVALVIQDIPKSASPIITDLSENVYIRFHGPKGNYRDSYPDYFLSEYSTFIKEYLDEGKTVYVYFNNTMGDAFKNLEVLNSFCCRT